MNTHNKKSHSIPYLLRHSSLPDHKGWVRVETLVNDYDYSTHEVKQIVLSDTDGRYEFSEDFSCVRALYGHSIDVDLELIPTTPPNILYHGTAYKYIQPIMQEGLKSRKRNYVHLTETTDRAIKTGSRHGVPALLVIDAAGMARDGYELYKAQNNVWLTKSVPTEYLKIIGNE